MRRKRTAGIFHIVKNPTETFSQAKTWKTRTFSPAAIRRVPFFPFTMCSPAQLPAAHVRSVFRCVPEFPARLHAVPLMSGKELVLPNFFFSLQPHHQVSYGNMEYGPSVALFTIAHLFGISSKPRLTFQKMFSRS